MVAKREGTLSYKTVAWRTLIMLGLAVGISPAASAANYYYCVIQDYGGNEVRYITDIMETAARINTDDTGHAFNRALADQLRRDYPADASSRNYCSQSTNLAYLREEHSALLSNNPAARRSSFTNPPVPSRPVESSGASGLVIREGPKPRTAAELEAEQLSYKRQQAAEAARLAAATARTNAEMQRRIAEVIARLKRRGMAQ